MAVPPKGPKPHTRPPRTPKPQTNGTQPEPPTFTLVIEEPELILLHQMLRTGTFEDAISKLIAGGLHQKVEGIIRSVQGTQELPPE